MVIWRDLSYLPSLSVLAWLILAGDFAWSYTAGTGLPDNDGDTRAAIKTDSDAGLVRSHFPQKFCSEGAMVSYGEKRRLVKKPKSGVKRISIEKYSPGNELYVVDIKRIKKAAARIAFKDYPAEQTQLVPQIIEAVNKVHKPYDGKVTLNEHGLEVVCRELKVPKSYLRAVKSRNISKASSQLKHYPDCQIIIKSGSSKRRWSIVHTAHVHDSHDGSHSQDPPTIPPVIRRRK